MAHNIDKIRDTQSDVQRNLEKKKGELSKLEENKQALLDAGTDVQNSEMDEDTKRTVMDLINSELEANAEKGEEKSQEMNDDLQKLESAKEEVETMKESSTAERQKLEEKGKILERMGLGGKVEAAISDMQTHEAELDSLHQEIMKDQEELNNISQKLSSL